MLNISWLKKDKAKSETATPVPPDIPGILSIRSVDDLLSPHRGMMVQIDELAGLSERNFNRYYLQVIRNFARFVQRLPASEVHHHAGPGGMLTHTLEVCVIALKVRRSYLLSETGGAEEIAAKQDLWTYAIFMAALCHDLAKVAVDQAVTVYNNDNSAKPWSPWDSFLDEQGAWYTTQFVRGRQYRLHEKASLLLIHRIVQPYALNWLSGDRNIFAQWLACVSGDIENASSIGEIVGIADSKSVATNLGADSSRMPAVKTKPLHEKMLTALRHLLHEGELPLNRNGAAGWISGEDCWLVSKRTVDAIREQLTQEGHTGIPTKNGRMFDILQEQSILIPYGDKAIWPVRVQGEGWQNELTMIRIAVTKIWLNPEHRPDEFSGRIIPATEGPEATTEAVNPTLPEKSLVDIKVPPEDNTIDYRKEEEDLAIRETEESPSLNSDKNQDEYDLMDFLPTETDIYEEAEPILQDKKKGKTLALDESLLEPAESLKTKTAQTEPFNPEATQVTSKSTTTAQKSVSRPAEVPYDDGPVDQFFGWLRNGIQQNEIQVNRPKARVHVVNEGVALITPGIFQDYASQQNKQAEWSVIQKKVLKKNWHVKDEQGLNMIRYQVAGSNKSTKVNVILFTQTSLVFGETTPPTVNPHLTKS